MGLFRQQALEAQGNRLQGQVVLVPRWPHALVTAFVLLWVAAALIFLTQSNYARRETVRGWLEPASGVIRVYPQSEGRLASLLVSAGDTVSAGQALAVINGDHVLQDGKILETLLLREYRDQGQNFQRQLQRAGSLSDARRTELRTGLESGKNALEKLQSQQEALDQRVALALKRLRRHKQLAASGHINQATLDELQERVLVLETETQQLDLQRIRQRSRLRELTAALDRLPQEAGNTADRLRLEISNIAQKIARLRGNRAYLVQAPRSGKVGTLEIAVGEMARYDKPLLTLLPSASPLVARLLVPVRAAGFLREGQLLSIRYDAYPYQKYGVYAGRLESVADSATLSTDRVQFPMPINEPVYRVTARLGDTRIHARGERLPLKTGMTFSADIILDDRSLLQWLLEPLYSLRGRLT